MVPRNRVRLICRECGEPFQVKASRAGKARYCSWKCYRAPNRVRIEGDVAYIELTNQERTEVVAETVIGAEDLELVRSTCLRWFAVWWPKVNRYKACGKIGKKNVSLHRVLMRPGPGEEVDHINGNTLDNRRANLRIVTPTQNRQNLTRLRAHNTSGFRGVWLDRRRNKWGAEIRVNNEKIWVGYHDTAEEAAEAAAHARRVHMTHSPD